MKISQKIKFWQTLKLVTIIYKNFLYMSFFSKLALKFFFPSSSFKFNPDDNNLIRSKGLTNSFFENKASVTVL